MKKFSKLMQFASYLRFKLGVWHSRAYGLVAHKGSMFAAKTGSKTTPKPEMDYKPAPAGWGYFKIMHSIISKICTV